MDPKTLKEILEWHVPKSTFEGHTFHGLGIFYRKFINNFSGICAPLTAFMRKGEFKWSAATQKGFELLKEKVTARPILAFLDFDSLPSRL